MLTISKKIQKPIDKEKVILNERLGAFGVALGREQSWIQMPIGEFNEPGDLMETRVALF